MFWEIITNISNFMLELGYVGIFFMMFLESSFFPFPSEVAMIPAWYFSKTWEMNFLIAFLAWTAWALVGAIFNYFIWYFLWDNVILKLIQKYWKYFLIKEGWYHKTKKYFIENWSLATFTGRLIPVIRQLISLPAWAFKMNFAKFLFFTWLWAGLWNLILMWIWYFVWDNKELISEYMKEFTIWWIIFVIILIFIYFMVKKYKKSEK